MDKATITTGRALGANQKLQKQRTQGGMTKPPLLHAKNDTGMKIYFLKHAIADAFKAQFERIDDLLKEKHELQSGESDLHKEMKELEKKEQENKTGLSKKDAERKEELGKQIQARIQEINEELNEIEKKEEEIELPEGKIHKDEIKRYGDVDDWEAIDFAIDFSKREN